MRQRAASWAASRIARGRIKVGAVCAAHEIGAADASDVLRLVSADSGERFVHALLRLRDDDVLTFESKRAATLQWDGRRFAGLDLRARGHRGFGRDAETDRCESDCGGLEHAAAGQVGLQLCAGFAVPLLADADFRIRLVCHEPKVGGPCADEAREISRSCQGWGFVVAVSRGDSRIR